MSELGATAPLAGIRVVDLTTTFLGPYTTMLMARMGADVIKVEAGEGDVLRGVGAGRHPGMGPIFLATNHGKRSVALDLKSEPGAAALRALLDTADALVTNMRPAALARLGLDRATVCADRPGLVYTLLCGFGTGGPYRDRAAYDDVVQAASGLAALQGGTGEPTYVRSVVADKAVALMGLASVNAALLARERTGRGGYVEVPMFETMASFLLLEQQNARVLDPAAGTGYGRTTSPDRRPYRTADGHLGVVVYTDKQWRDFFALVGRDDLGRDPRFATIGGRTEHVDELYALLAEELPARTTAEWQEVLEPLGIPAQPVLTPDELFDDEHLAAVGMFEQLEHPTEGPVTLPRLPAAFGPATGEAATGEAATGEAATGGAATGGAATVRGAPRLGEHGAEVLREAGLDEEAIAAALGRPAG